MDDNERKPPTRPAINWDFLLKELRYQVDKIDEQIDAIELLYFLKPDQINELVKLDKTREAASLLVAILSRAIEQVGHG